MKNQIMFPRPGPAAAPMGPGKEIGRWAVRRILAEYPIAQDFFLNLNLPALSPDKTLSDALTETAADRLAEFGLTPGEIPEQLSAFLATMAADTEANNAILSITILGGQNKLLEPEDAALTIGAGEVVGIVGPTGSGKSRLLADIECLAQGDTPTKRRILVNGGSVGDEERLRLEGKIVAQLSQNMNFVMDLTVAEFLEMHARSRSARMAGDGVETTVRCFERANALAGEKFHPDTKLTQLSGGQSRALMIADTAYMSKSPIVLIDEIENAGVDRREAIALLASREKIVLISTHDPLLALGADKRIVIRNGGIYKIIETSPGERECLTEIERIDSRIQDIRRKLRSGAAICMGEGAERHVGVV